MVTEDSGPASAMWTSIMRIFISIMVLGILLLFMAVFSNINLNNSAEPHFFAFRTLSSEHGITNYDSVSGRVNTGVIDLETFENNIQVIQKSVDYGEEKHIGAKFTLKELDGKIIKSIIYNPKIQRRVAEKGIAGPGGVDETIKQIPIILKDKDSLRNARLDISIIVERSRWSQKKQE